MRQASTLQLGIGGAKDLAAALWKPPSADDHSEEKGVERQLTSLEQQGIDAVEEKTRYPGYEVLIRVVVSSSTAVRSQTLLKNVVAAFSLLILRQTMVLHLRQPAM